jgi:hypothetical protein
MRARRGLAAIAVAGAMLVVGGCGSSDRDDVRAKVRQFLDATRTKDYKTLCDQVLAPVLVEHIVSAGLQCEQALGIALGGVSEPTLLIGRITIAGKDASAITLSGAKGQQSSLDAIQLIKTSSGWRVKSLGSPVTPATKK